MANEVGSAAHSGGTVVITGLKELVAKLRAAEADLQDLKDLNHRVGNIVISNANPPRDSGELGGTLRAGKGWSKAVVRAGYAKRGAHAGVVHYGNPHTGSRANPFLTDALKRSQTAVVSEYVNGIDAILRKNNLN